MSSDRMVSDEQVTDSTIGEPLGEIEESPHWTPQDGTRIHTIYGEAVQDAIEDVDNDIEVDNRVQVTVPGSDKAYGEIDTLITQGDTATVVEYKTHDMSQWTPAKADRMGNEHGQQVAEYVASPDLPENTSGVIIATGRPPEDPTAQEAYVAAANVHEVDVKFTEDGRPEDVVATVEEVINAESLGSSTVTESASTADAAEGSADGDSGSSGDGDGGGGGDGE